MGFLIAIIVLALVIFVGVLIAGVYNHFIRLRQRTDEAWADVDVQLKRRYDLIPNLVDTVKGYATHERKTLEDVIKARNMGMNAQTVKEQENADNMLTGALKSLFALSEAYPDLKANVNFLELQRELADTENKIQAARRFYNGNVRDLNTLVQSFPSNIVAGMFSFEERDFFELEADSAAREVPKVDF